MGFDNECILNIQSLAGEYFCPVCRLLVYPNEALQSQCTHLYCKPCLTYTVSTTRACPYDGYLVTEADAKPLVESNKTLAETIGKIAVHCLYHRSGCTWQGPLSECTSHCSGCAFGNSPVVCNRCGIQIVHRQVQEHAQNCPGVQPQAQQAEGALDTSASGTSATVDQTQAATQTGSTPSQAQASQTPSANAPGSDPNQKTNPSSQAQPVVQAAVSSADQWYQQYQQHYQQYPGYDPYQQQYQNYYPYQQPAVVQSQQQNLLPNPPYGTVQHQSQPLTQPPQQPQISQAQSQPQIQPSHVQAPVAAQTQNQAQVNQLQQLHPSVQTYPQAHGQSHPQPLPYFQAPSHSQPHPQHVQMPQYQQPPIQQHTQSQLHQPNQPLSQPQPHSQAQSQAQLQQHSQPHSQTLPSQPMNATVQPQMQHPLSHAVTGNHLYPQPQPHLQQQLQSGAPQQHIMHMQSQGVPHSQSQTPVQVPSQFPQQPALMRPPLSHTAIPNQQQPGLLPSPGQVQNINLAQQQQVHSYAQQPGNSVHQRPVVQAVQQPIPQQYFQHQPYAQQQLPTQLRPQSQSHSFPQHAFTQFQQNAALSQGIQHSLSNPVGRPIMPGHGIQSQPYAQNAGGVQMRPMHPAVNHPSTNQNTVKINNLVQGGVNLRPTMSESQMEKEPELSAQKAAQNVARDLGAASSVIADSELKTEKSEMDMKPIDGDNKASGEDKTNQGDAASKEIPESRGLLGAVPDHRALENGESVSKSMLKEEGVGSNIGNSSNGKLDEVVGEGANNGPSNEIKQRVHKEIPSEEVQLREEGSQAVSTSAPTSQVQASHPVPISDQGKHLPPLIHHGPTILQQRPGAPSLQVPPPGPPHHTQGPGHLTHLRPQGPVPGRPFHLSEHFQPPGSNLGFGASSGRANQHGQLPAPHTGASRIQGEPVGGPPFGLLPFDSHGGRMERAATYGSEGERNQQRPAIQMEQGALGQPSGIHPNMLRTNGTPGLDSSSIHGLRDERFKAFPDERLNAFPADPTRRLEFEDGLKQFPRPSYLDSDPVSKFGNYSSRGPHGPKYDSGMNVDSAAGTAPSRFLPYDLGGSVHGNDGGNIGRKESSRGHSDFVGRRLMDGLAPRSPVRDYPGIPSHGFRGFGPDDFDGREFHRFGDPLGHQIHEGRFPNLPGHFRRGEFEGPGNMRMVDHVRNDLIGQDGHPGHFRRGEHLGPNNMPSHLHLREPVGFGAHHSRMGDMAGPGNFESFRGNRPSHPRLGEPGFRSSFSLQRFPNDGTYTGDLESFDQSRKRRPATMGWCRICKVDCETVEGLDLHSQTKEHQKMAMDMVRTIKQNAKKKKLASGDQSLEDANKSKVPVLKTSEKSID